MHDDRHAACLALLRAWCAENHVCRTGDDRVPEEVAAALLGLAAPTLANMRRDGSGPQWFRIGGSGHRITYRLDHLATWIEARRCESPH